MNANVRTECGLTQFPPKPVPQLSPAPSSACWACPGSGDHYRESEPLEWSDTNTEEEINIQFLHFIVIEDCIHKKRLSELNYETVKVM